MAALESPTTAEVTVATFPCADADSHLMELPGWFEAYVSEPTRTLLRGIDLSCAGASTESDVRATLDRLALGDPVAPPAARLMGDKAWLAFGGGDARERSLALDVLGFERQLVITTLATTMFPPRAPAAVTVECVDAHNRAVTDFCSQDPRLMPAAFVPIEDPDVAVVAAERAAELGCAAALVPFGAPPLAPSHPVYDDLWSVFASARMPVVFHLGHGTQGVPGAFHDNGVPTTDFLGSERSLRAKDTLVAHHALEVFVGCLVLDGVLDRFPDLTLVCLEFGAGWVPDFMRRLDLMRRYRATEPLLAALPLAPSDYVKRQMLFCPQPDEDVEALLETCPPELHAFSSDFPHPEGSDDPVGAFDRMLVARTEHERSLFFRENFRRVFGE